MIDNKQVKELSFADFRAQVLNDYKTACLSREASLLGRREVLTGKAKFGIFGDGKELAQIVLSKFYKEGDFRSGYYRDQTWMLSSGVLDLEKFFAQLFAISDTNLEPFSGGRQMNAHYGNRLLDDNGQWKDLTQMKNTASDMSATASQIPRLLGLAYASKLYRNVDSLSSGFEKFTKSGNEVAYGSIGDASTSEGHFWEMINAAAVLQVPLVLSIWDDGYGISVPYQYQRSKKSFEELLSGFKRTEDEKGIEVITVNGWDYKELIDAYQKADKLARTEHIPVVVHVKELTQPQGHSTSGSHERYKTEERLSWEKEFDCNKKFKQWILSYGIDSEQGDVLRLATESELEEIQIEAKEEVKQVKQKVWLIHQSNIQNKREKALALISSIKTEGFELEESLIQKLETKKKLYKKDVFVTVREILRQTAGVESEAREILKDWYSKQLKKETEKYSSGLYSEFESSSLNVAQIKPEYPQEAKVVDGRVLLRDNFDALLAKHNNLFIFGEDAGKIGGVNQGLEGLQDKYGEDRVFDVGIREQTIMGQGIGMALRGLRPIAEIQYLDYVLYCLQTLSDDLACTHWRTAKGQKVPFIIRTRGHRLEGVWHSGSPMSGILGFVRGMYVCVPRDFVKAAGFYNTLLQGDDPAIVIESLNGYRLKEHAPLNLGEFTEPLGKIDVTKQGKDLTIVTYGSTWKLVTEAAKKLALSGIDVEVIDVQTLLPLDIGNEMVESIKKTNKLLVVDEDVPGGASAYIMNEILENQKGYYYLDSMPRTLTGKAHRPAYSSDGDYFSNPSVEDIIETAYQMIHEENPEDYPSIF